MKKSKRVRDRIYRISFKGKDGKLREPEKKFETYRRVTVDGVKKKETVCFATIEEAMSFRDSGGIAITTPQKGMLLCELAEVYKAIHFPHIEESSRENILKVFPDPEERRLAKEAGKDREYPCDFLMQDEVSKIDTVRIDEWLAHIKRPEYLTTLKCTKLSFRQEMKFMKPVFVYYASRLNQSYRIPFAKDHNDKLKIKSAPPKVEKDLPAEKLAPFLRFVEEYCADGPYAYVMAKMAEAQYRIYGRIQEAAAIHVENADLLTGRIELNWKIQYLKKGKQRAILKPGHKENGGKIFYGPDAARLIAEVARHRGIISGPLFFVDGQPIPYKAIQNAYNYGHKMAQTGQRSTHVLRHGSLKEFQEASGDINQTKKMAGHADLGSTVRYASARSQALSEAQEQVEEKLRTLRLVR